MDIIKQQEIPLITACGIFFCHLLNGELNKKNILESMEMYEQQESSNT
jgi:hypothetical protein